MIIRTLVHGLVAAGLIAGAGMAWAENGQPDATSAPSAATVAGDSVGDKPVTLVASGTGATAGTGYRAVPDRAAGQTRGEHGGYGGRGRSDDDDDDRRRWSGTGTQGAMGWRRDDDGDRDDD
ncbi:hypothetical protein [Rhodospira trueperi]|uniref:Uncharacterized protein n=1 Tax=Rhodospira trueperi TaxID=69960 RepID=A0A1G7FFF5_9PROT|nr:hypothetical protein [Rhodospira trueperi]SDE74295.1 hypothetical protein SAMN05421720_11133 [Rhodospira trueperi]